MTNKTRKAIATIALMLAAPSAFAVSPCPVKKLSHELPIFSEILFVRLTPDGTHGIYVGDFEVDSRWEMYSRPLLGGPVVKLSLPLGPDGSYVPYPIFTITPDSATVYYLARDGIVVPQTELYAVPVVGGSSTRINDPLVAGGRVDDFVLADDGASLVYIADQETVGVDELYRVDLGNGVVTKLNAALVAGGDVRYARISPDGTAVLYWADQETDGKDELYRVDATGGPVTKLNQALDPGADVGYGAIFSPDGATVVFDADPSGKTELFSVPAGGGVPVRLNPTLEPGRQVNPSWWQITPDSSRVLYLAALEVSGAYELYSVPIGGGASVKLNDDVVMNGDVYSDFVVTPDSAHVVYQRDWNHQSPREVFSATVVDGVWTRLNTDLPANNGEVRTFRVSADGTTVVYCGEQNYPFKTELFSIAIPDGIGVGLPTRISPAEPQSADVGIYFELTPDSQRALFIADLESNDDGELYSVPIGGGALFRHSPPVVPGGDAYGLGMLVGPASDRVVFRGDYVRNGAFELYQSLLPGYDTDGDGLDNCADPCGWDAANDADTDGFCADADCAPGDAGLWSVPGEVELLLGDNDGTTTIQWIPPGETGGLTPALTYDVVRTPQASSFDAGAAICLEADEGADTVASDGETPGLLFFYLVLARNDCGRGAPGRSDAVNVRAPIACEALDP